MKLRRWLIALVVVVVLGLTAYAGRDWLERVAIAYRIYDAHVFMPPEAVRDESRLGRVSADARFYWDFSAIRVAREKRLREIDPVLKPLVKEIARRQAAGEGMQYSMHIYREIRWLLNFTPDMDATRTRVADLRRSLTQPDRQKLAARQLASDGSWGLGIDTWYLRLYYTVEDGLDKKTNPQYPLRFLDRINSPEKLTAHLNALLHDDFTQTGVFNREELDETFSAMARLLFRGERTGYAFDPRLGDALRGFVAQWQNPATGMWGQWLIDRDGRVWKMDDMAMTFHVVSDLSGNVGHLDSIAKRVLQLDGVEFPVGIRFNGHYEDHLNMDVVKILRYAWPHIDETTRRNARSEISRMLEWCLTKSYRSDGSFRVSDLDDTVGDAYSYGVDFLKEAGYFRREDRFWTDRDFPEAKAVASRIQGRLQGIGLNDPELKDAYEELQTVR